MIDPKLLEEFGRKLEGLLPPGMENMREEFGRNARSLLQATLARMDLVTREEFEAQKAVLARTREKLEALEQKLKELESGSH